MIDNILHINSSHINGLGEGSSSSRSGASSSGRSGESSSVGNTYTQTYSIATPGGTYNNLSLEQYEAAKYAVKMYDNAYGIAYTFNFGPPDWLAVVENPDAVVLDYAVRAYNANPNKEGSWGDFVRQYVASNKSKINIPEPNDVHSSPSTDNGEGSGMTWPLIIFTLIGIGAFALAHAKPKRRR